MHFINHPMVDTSETMEVFRYLVDKYMPPPESAPCFNHDALIKPVMGAMSESYGLTWQELYWGSTNLARLKSIKMAYDPNAIFTCRDCVTASDVDCPIGCVPTGYHSWRKQRKLLFGSLPSCPLGCEAA